MSNTTRTSLIDTNNNTTNHSTGNNPGSWFGTVGSNQENPYDPPPNHHQSIGQIIKPYETCPHYESHSAGLGPNELSIGTTNRVHITSTTSKVPMVQICGLQFQCHTQLCLLVAGLSILVTLNAVLLLWIITMINLSNLKIDQSFASHNNNPNLELRPGINGQQEQIDLFGGVLVNGGLQVESIVAPPNRHFRLQSLPEHDIRFGPAAGSGNGNFSWLELKLDQIVAHAHNLVVRSSLNDDLLLLIQAEPPRTELSGLNKNSLKSGLNSRRTIVGVDSLKIAGSAGLNLNSSVQVPSISSDQNLLVWSPNRQVIVRGPRGINIRSIRSHFSGQYSQPPNFIDIRKSSIDPHLDSQISDTFQASSRTLVHLLSRNNKIVLRGSTVAFSPRLTTVHPSRHGQTYPTIGQMCVCANTGLLFMARSHHPDGCLHTGKRECHQSERGGKEGEGGKSEATSTGQNM